MPSVNGDAPADTGRRALKVGLIAVVTLVAFESLAVITILPDIEDDLGGIAWYGWVTTAFFLGTMIGIVFAGDQADRRGAGWPYRGRAGAVRRRPDRRWPGPVDARARAGRFVQGFGAGVVPAIGYVAIGRAFSEAERPRMFALLSTAWVVPGLLGPVLAERIVGGRRMAVGVPRTGPARCRRRVARRAGDGPPRPARRAAPDPVTPFRRRRMLEASRVAAGAALIVASFNASRWLLVPGDRRRPARRPRPADAA